MFSLVSVVLIITLVRFIYTVVCNSISFLIVIKFHQVSIAIIDLSIFLSMNI